MASTLPFWCSFGAALLLLAVCAWVGTLSVRLPLLTDLVYVALAGLGLYAVHRLDDSSAGSYFAVLVAGMVASAGYQPFQPLLLYGGYPGWHTWLMLAVVLVNAAGNFLLIAWLGPIGSAIATGAAFVAGVLVLRALVRQRMGLAI